jgi:hypothetical protein
LPPELAAELQQEEAREQELEERYTMDEQSGQEQVTPNDSGFVRGYATSTKSEEEEAAASSGQAGGGGLNEQKCAMGKQSEKHAETREDAIGIRGAAGLEVTPVNQSP